MCLYPRLIKNKRYYGYTTKQPKNGATCAKPIDDYRKQFVAVGCGNCIECRKQKAREWQIRLCEELKVWKYKYFVTLTFESTELKKLCEECSGYTNVNIVARDAVRRFLERWRKKHKKSLKHWFITELGHEGTERIHLHGLIFSNDEISNDKLAKYWKYGQTYTGDYCNEKTINYIIKYVTKIDINHKGYVADIFCSGGIGSNYINEYTKQKHRYNGKDTIQYYTLSNGQKMSLPKYYRNKLWTQAERDNLWTYLLNSDRTFVRGIELRHISRPNGYNDYINLLHEQQRNNTQLGYGDSSSEWDEQTYKVTFDMINKKSKG